MKIVNFLQKFGPSHETEDLRRKIEELTDQLKLTCSKAKTDTETKSDASQVKIFSNFRAIFLEFFFNYSDLMLT